MTSFSNQLAVDLPTVIIGQPASDADIEAAEAALGAPLPLSLREIYLSCGTLLGPTDIPLLAPLIGSNSLTEMTLSLRSDTVSGFPAAIIAGSLFFGHDGGGVYFGLPVSGPSTPFRWEAGWGSHIEADPQGILHLWKSVVNAYDFPADALSLLLPPPGTHDGGPRSVGGLQSRATKAVQPTASQPSLFHDLP